MQLLPDNGFRLFLQPKVNLQDRSINHAEGLMRFFDPAIGIVPLKDILQQLQQENRLASIDLLLFEDLCKKLRYWLDFYKKPIYVSVNLCRDYFLDASLICRYTQLMARYSIPPALIELELVETNVLEALDQVSALVNHLRIAGIPCSLDDFGSGYSSFQLLTTIHLDVLKIDRSLFTDPRNTKEQVVLRHILQTAQELGIKTVAEGVEQPAYPPLLRALGCDYVQGYVYYKPMPAAEFEQRFLLNNERAPL